MDHLELANQISVQKLHEKLDLVKKICTADGFYQYWFNKLPEKENFPTNKACFDHVNELHFDLLGHYRYNDYKAFNRYISRRNKQLKNNNGR